MSEKRMSSEPISPQRSPEDDDLLERSTKKTKVRIGSTGNTSADDSGSSPSGDLRSEAESDMVAETPSDVMPQQVSSESPMQVEVDTPSDVMPQQVSSESPMQVEMDNVVPVADVSATAGGSTETPPPAVQGDGKPKSYLDSVALVQPTVASLVSGEEQVQHSDVRHNPPIPVEPSNGRGAASRARPYGPWMIVTRADRRPAGRPPGQNGSTGNNKGNNFATGSRFEPLDGSDNSDSLQGDCAAAAGGLANDARHISDQPETSRQGSEPVPAEGIPSPSV
nr:hypothetical protein CDL15_Pgr024682 [Ipomoea batatas]